MISYTALGGEYGGAATYVAEHAPSTARGFWTSWIQTTATIGLFLSLAVIITVKQSMSIDDFNEWGWRIPFWISIIMDLFTLNTNNIQQYTTGDKAVYTSIGLFLFIFVLFALL